MKNIILTLVLALGTATLAAAQPKTGNKAAEISSKDINGKAVKLSSMRSKYVVVDFWASWCGPCMRGMTDMKKYYAKYKKNVEFLGVSCDSDSTAWKNAVKNAALPWRHINLSSKSDVFSKYNISGLPTKVIIDKKGKVVYSCVGESPDFYTKLETLLK